MTKDGVNEIIAHMRRKASSNKKLKIRFRYVINILKKSSQLAWDRGKDYIDDVIIRETIEDYAKPIGQQILEHNIEKSQPYKIIKTKGEEVGLVNGLVVIKYSHGDEDSTGDIAPVSAYVRRVKTDKHADFVVTGIANPDKSEWIQDSIKTVRTAIYRLYGEDLARRYYVHVSFLQSRGVDGPSAGVTMTLALMSLLGDPDVPKEDRKPIPLRQDTAVTGTVENIGVNGNDVRVGAIGGVAEKSFGARKRGIHRIIVPRENFESSVEAADFKRMKIRLVPAATVKEYFNLIRADRRKQK
jgi:lon-related putative ATP-dependent protease